MFHSTIVGTVGRVCARNVPPSVRPSPTLVWTHPPGSVTSASKKLTNRKPLRHAHTYTHTYLYYFGGVSRSVGKDATKKDDDNSSDLPLEYLQSSLAHESQVHTHNSYTHTSYGCDSLSSLFSFSSSHPLSSPSPSHLPQAPPASNPNVQLQEEDDLQLAIAMSLNEQENKVT